VTLPPAPTGPDPLDERLAAFDGDGRLARRSRELDERPEFPWPEFREMGSVGLLGLTVPKAAGGQGLSALRAGRLLFGLAARGGTVFAKLSLQPEFSSVLCREGSGALQAEYFQPLVRGERLVGNFITEPDAGSDVGAIRTHARRHGDRYVLEGTKSEAAFAEDASAGIVYARTDGAAAGSAGLSAFLVPLDLPGVEREVVPDMGERWMRRGRVLLHDVSIPLENRIGPEGGILASLRGELTHERALLASIYLGVGWASWRETVVYTGERRAFDQTLSRHEGVSFPLVEDWARLESAWTYVERLLQRLDRGDAVDGEAALAKWLCGSTALLAVDHAIQFHGGRGYSRGLPHEQRYRDLRSAGLAHGTSEIAHVVAARSLWSSAGSKP
jgi:cyclohexanecarboxyl-CoA dehydrogenase